MQIKADVTLPYPRERVFAAYRDRLAELTAYLPNIQDIRVKERKEREDGRIELVNEWSGGGDIPAAARSFIKESMLRWTDYATWDATKHTCDWRTEVHAFPGAIKSSGTNFYLTTSDGGTRLEIRGDLVCDATKIPGVPRLLAKTVGSAVEKVLVGSISTNLVAVGKGVGKMLAKDEG
jgi:hypothetical protein